MIRRPHWPHSLVWKYIGGWIYAQGKKCRKGKSALISNHDFCPNFLLALISNHAFGKIFPLRLYPTTIWANVCLAPIPNHTIFKVSRFALALISNQKSLRLYPTTSVNIKYGLTQKSDLLTYILDFQIFFKIFLIFVFKLLRETIPCLKLVADWPVTRLSLEIKCFSLK